MVLLPPPGAALKEYDRSLAPSEQPTEATTEDGSKIIPQIFVDAMHVREQVFVREFKVPRENEFDQDDARCAHWVAYAGISPSSSRKKEDNAVGLSWSPVGTLRLVPFPHNEHPLAGGMYVDGKLTNEDNLVAINDMVKGKQMSRTVAGAKKGIDRPTTYHDGQEPYLKLGRLAVVPTYRREGVAGVLVNAALEALSLIQYSGSSETGLENFLDFSNTEVDQIGIDENGARWRGLLCVHARSPMMELWRRYGFLLDEQMGTWWEEGMSHVGMFMRMEAKR